MLLFRQISPAKIRKDGTPGHSNFKPTDQDNGALSTRREEITAEGAYRAHLELELPSLGTWGITVRETHDVGLPAYDDEHLDGHPEYHVSIHFPKTDDRKVIERLAKDLHQRAKQHGEDGWLYGPVQPDSMP
jgi:hypothetical protein